MKAITYTTYGPPEVLQLQELSTPVPEDNDVLVKIYSASVNSWDWDLVRGKPRVYRLLFGLLKPRHPIIGSDIAGQVEAVGKNVTKLKPGDAVFGDISGCGFGAFAEYVSVPEDILATKPEWMSFEQAAALPQAGVLALQALRQADLREGEQVLINGAGGGAGTFAIQLAKGRGAKITGVDRAEKLELMRSLGADRVLDYLQKDFTKNGQQYDVILDMVAQRSLSEYKRVLKPGGRGIIVGGSPGRILQVALFGRWMEKNKTMNLLLHRPNREDLEELKGLVEAGTIQLIIDRQYPLDRASEAIRYVGEGRAKGKVVITME